MAKVDNMGGNPQDCQPQDCLLVDNPEVGNSEYIHYSYHAIVVDVGFKT